ncbi:uncharacterized protein LOC126881220 [Diabrotica virgifera virgifera]|uniref:SIAH-type domain-containing protein n=1 Tax=Diabrotica virgifera virgifera TaxID=50390 RepID=A0ABM5JTP6_DIAVI|nr:uncharacterized protein LOC126881220 [Diabrotica virgifera virgifera]
MFVMAFIIPDKILEPLICTFCHKYLSVKPVTVYRNRDVECGRCTQADKQNQRIGVESLYGRIAETCLFKCINRFDGCRELLTYSQVVDHEKICLEKIHKCPICYEEVTSFLILRHFNSNHKDAVLNSPAFVFDLNDYSETPSTFIYQEEDNLFFLYISYSKSENTIKLELVYLGSDKLALNIYHQFTVTSKNKDFYINYNSKPSHTNEFFIVDATNMSNLINVKFKLIYHNLQFFTISENDHSSSIKNSSLENQIDTQEKNQFIYKSKFDLTSEIVEFPLEYNPECFNCKESCIFSLSDFYPVTYYYSPTHKDFLCFCCFEWLTDENKTKGNHLYLKQMMTSSFLSRFCKYNCGQHFSFSKILEHEVLYCTKSMDYYNCPVQHCLKKDVASGLRNHLSAHHGYTLCASFFDLPYLPTKCFVFLKGNFIHFQLTKGTKSRYDVECKIVTKDSVIQSKWKPHVLFFNKSSILKPLENLHIEEFSLRHNYRSPQCSAKIVLVKNE